jgi:flagellar biosynthesis protein FlhB
MTDAKTEEPTRRRLAKARAEGDSGASAFASQAVGLAVAALLVPAAIAAVAERAGLRIREAIAAASDAEPRVTFDAWRAAGDLVLLTLPALAAVAVAAGAAQLVQTGGIVSGTRLEARLDRLRPFAGARAMLSRERLFTVARAALGGAIAAWLVARVLRSRMLDLVHLSGRLGHVAPAAASLAETLARDAAIASLVLAAVDVAVVRGLWTRRLRMSRREVERERKESEIAPMLDEARSRARSEMLAAATIASVKSATVVVTSPTPIACALRYDEDEKRGARAPVVVACGTGDFAEQILRAARAFGVPVVRDVPLAQALVGLDVGDVIPEAQYEAAAEILRLK